MGVAFALRLLPFLEEVRFSWRGDGWGGEGGGREEGEGENGCEGELHVDTKERGMTEWLCEKCRVETGCKLEVGLPSRFCIEGWILASYISKRTCGPFPYSPRHHTTRW